MADTKSNPVNLRRSISNDIFSMKLQLHTVQTLIKIPWETKLMILFKSSIVCKQACMNTPTCYLITLKSSTRFMIQQFDKLIFLAFHHFIIKHDAIISPSGIMIHGIVNPCIIFLLIEHTIIISTVLWK